MDNVQQDVADGCLIIRFPGEWTVLSWAPFNGGHLRSSCVFNCQRNEVPKSGLDAFFRERVATLGLPQNAVGLLTAREVKDYQEARETGGPMWVHAWATVGLTNARAVGDEADVKRGVKTKKAGTINIIVATNALPRLSGLAEAVQVATMARTRALMEAGVTSRKSGKPATGTGTDCIAVAASGEVNENYCGMHTMLGQLIGRTVHAAVARGIPLSS